MSDLRGRLATAYQRAMAARHDSSGVVSIHLSKDILEQVEAEFPGVEVADWLPQTLWGFPLIIEEDTLPGHISVHTTEFIH